MKVEHEVFTERSFVEVDGWTYKKILRVAKVMSDQTGYPVNIRNSNLNLPGNYKVLGVTIYDDISVCISPSSLIGWSRVKPKKLKRILEGHAKILSV